MLLARMQHIARHSVHRGRRQSAFEVFSVIVKCFGCRGVGGADLAGIDHAHGVSPAGPMARSAESENGPRHGAAQIARP